jgi:hypothetical protein
MYSTPNVLSKAASSCLMKFVWMSQTKNGMGIKGLIVPKSTTIPKRITTMPRYMGFLVARYIPSVTKCVDSSNGFIGVPNLPKAVAAQMTTEKPIMISNVPGYVSGGCRIVRNGARKCRPVIVTTATRK